MKQFLIFMIIGFGIWLNMVSTVSAQTVDTLCLIENISGDDTTVIRRSNLRAGNFIYLDYEALNANDATVDIYFSPDKVRFAAPTMANNPTTLDKSTPTAIINGDSLWVVGWEKDYFSKFFGLKITPNSATSGALLLIVD